MARARSPSRPDFTVSLAIEQRRGLRVSWKTWTPRQRLRAIQGGAGLGAFVLHLGLLLILRPDPHFRAPPAAILDPFPPFVVTLVRPPRPRTDKHRAATASRGRQDQPRAAAPIAGPVARLAPSGAPALPPAPAGAATPGRNPGQQAASPGVNWGQPPADAAARRALRSSVGCDLGITLSRAERDACDERMGRDRLKPNSGRPLMADRRRQAEFEAEADYKNRLRRYKGDSMPPGHFESLRDLGGQPPPRP